MDDLVNRLRAPEQWRSFPEIDDDAPFEAAARIEEQAVEIARLREALAKLVEHTEAMEYERAAGEPEPFESYSLQQARAALGGSDAA